METAENEREHASQLFKLIQRLKKSFAISVEAKGYKDIAEKLRAIAKADTAEYWARSRMGRSSRGMRTLAGFALNVDTFTSVKPPEECPSCKHSRAYYVAQDLLSI